MFFNFFLFWIFVLESLFFNFVPLFFLSVHSRWWHSGFEHFDIVHLANGSYGISADKKARLAISLVFSGFFITTR